MNCPDCTKPMQLNTNLGGYVCPHGGCNNLKVAPAPKAKRTIPEIRERLLAIADEMDGEGFIVEGDMGRFTAELRELANETIRNRTARAAAPKRHATPIEPEAKARVAEFARRNPTMSLQAVADHFHLGSGGRVSEILLELEGK